MCHCWVHLSYNHDQKPQGFSRSGYINTNDSGIICLNISYKHKFLSLYFISFCAIYILPFPFFHQEGSICILHFIMHVLCYTCCFLIMSEIKETFHFEFPARDYKKFFSKIPIYFIWHIFLHPILKTACDAVFSYATKNCAYVFLSYRDLQSVTRSKTALWAVLAHFSRRFDMYLIMPEPIIYLCVTGILTRVMPILI